MFTVFAFYDRTKNSIHVNFFGAKYPSLNDKLKPLQSLRMGRKI